MLSDKRTHGLENLVKLKGKNREIVEVYLTNRQKKNTYTNRTYQTSIDIFFKNVNISVNSMFCGHTSSHVSQTVQPQITRSSDSKIIFLKPNNAIKILPLGL